MMLEACFQGKDYCIYGPIFGLDIARNNFFACKMFKMVRIPLMSPSDVKVCNIATWVVSGFICMIQFFFHWHFLLFRTKF